MTPREMNARFMRPGDMFVTKSPINLNGCSDDYVTKHRTGEALLVISCVKHCHLGHESDTQYSVYRVSLLSPVGIVTDLWSTYDSYLERLTPA